MVTRVLDTVLDRALLGYGNVGYLRPLARAGRPPPRLDGKVVLVTGAKAGLGRAIAEGLGRARRDRAACLRARRTPRR